MELRPIDFELAVELGQWVEREGSFYKVWSSKLGKFAFLQVYFLSNYDNFCKF